MEYNHKELGRARIMGTGTQDMSGIPHPCQYTDLNISDPTQVRDESMNWLKRLDMKIPIWSRLYPSNCVGFSRDISFAKEKNYNVEIPRRLFSLWGHVDTHEMVIEKMSDLKKYQWVCNVFICCAAVKYNLNEWDAKLLDDIVYRGCLIFTDLCQRNGLNNMDFSMRHLNTLMTFKKISYRVTVEQKAQGFMFMPYGYGEYNLARALGDFFRTYQFGMLQCDKRSLAFGFATDVEQGYFMYDCQSAGAPLFNQDAANAYVLRTDHLQVLLYCLTVAIGVTAENIPFKIYNVDVVIEDFREKIARKPSPVRHYSRSGSFEHSTNPLQWQLRSQQNPKTAENRFKGYSINYNSGSGDNKKDKQTNNEENKAYFKDQTSKRQSATDSLIRIGATGTSRRIAGGHEKVTDAISLESQSSDGTLINVKEASKPPEPPTKKLKNSNVLNKFPQFSYLPKSFSKPNQALTKPQNTIKQLTKPAVNVEKNTQQTADYIKAQAARYLRKIQFMDHDPFLAKLKQNVTKTSDFLKPALKTTMPRETLRPSSDRRPITIEKMNKPIKIEIPKSHYAQKNIEKYIRTVTNVVNNMHKNKSYTTQNAAEKKPIKYSPTKRLPRTSKDTSLDGENEKIYFKTRSDLDLVELYDVSKPNVMGAQVYLVNNCPNSEEVESIPHTIHITKTMF